MMPETSPESLDSLLPYVRRKMLPIHAVTIIHREGAHVFVGETASGKSTMALKALEEGMEVLGDDNAVLFLGSSGLYVSTPEDVPIVNELPLTERGNKVKTIRGIFKVAGLNFVVSIQGEPKRVARISKEDYAILLALISRTISSKGRRALSNTISCFFPSFDNTKFVVNPECFEIRELIESEPREKMSLDECVKKVEKYLSGLKRFMNDVVPKIPPKILSAGFKKIKRNYLDALSYDVSQDIQLIFEILNESIRKDAGYGWLIKVVFERKNVQKEKNIPLHFFYHPGVTKKMLLSASELEEELLKGLEVAKKQLSRVQGLLRNLREFEEFFKSLGFEVETLGGVSEAKSKDGVIVGYYPILATNDLRMLETWFINASKIKLAKYYYEDLTYGRRSLARLLVEDDEIKLLDLAPSPNKTI